MIRQHFFLILTGLALALAVALALLWIAESRPPTAAEPSATPPAAELQLRFGHNTPEDSALHQAAVRFAQQAAERSGGRIRISVHPDQQLGNDHEMVEMARAGELDILLTPTAKMSVPLPAMQYADLPFFFPAREDLYAMLDGEPGRMLLDKLRGIGLVGVTFWENGFKHFTANHPITGPEDFEGLKIRTMKSRIIMEQFRSFGATPIPIDFHATRQALADGVVDGQENPLIAIYSMGFHEVQSHLTLSSHAYLGYVLSISAKVFESLPQDIRQILLDTGRELTVWERAETARREQALLQQIREAGVRIHHLDEAARQAFAARTAHIPGLFEGVIGVDLLSKTQELLDQRYGDDAAIVIGLDADLSLDSRAAGLAIKRGATLAIEEINDAGGVLGHPLRLLARDHHAMPSKGVDNIRFFIDHPAVAAVLGGVHSPVAIAELDAIHAGPTPFIATWSAAAEVAENGHDPNYVFRVSANDRFAAPFIVDHVAAHFEHPALVVENTLWGRNNLERMQAHIAGLGRHFAAVEQINRGDQDFDPLVQRIVDSRADALVLVTSYQEGEHLLQALDARPHPLPVVAHWGVLGSDLWQRNQDLFKRLDFSFFQTFVFADASHPRARALSERYRQRYRIAPNRAIVAPVGVAQAYDAVHLLARAIQQAGKVEPSAIRTALESLPSHQGAIKTYDPPFTPERHDALGPQDYRMARFAPDGRIFVHPEEVAPQ